MSQPTEDEIKIVQADIADAVSKANKAKANLDEFANEGENAEIINELATLLAVAEQASIAVKDAMRRLPDDSKYKYLGFTKQASSPTTEVTAGMLPPELFLLSGVVKSVDHNVLAAHVKRGNIKGDILRVLAGLTEKSISDELPAKIAEATTKNPRAATVKMPHKLLADKALASATLLSLYSND
jgi:hypothetical protein